MSALFGWLSSPGARGELVRDEVTIRARPLSPEGWRILFRQALQDEKAAALHHELITRRLAELREMAMASRDLRRVLAEEDARGAEGGPTPARPPVEMWRVKVLEGFSTHWDDLLYYGPAGSIIDVPRALAEAVPPGRFERVDPATPLFLVAPR